LVVWVGLPLTMIASCQASDAAPDLWPPSAIDRTRPTDHEGTGKERRGSEDEERKERWGSGSEGKVKVRMQIDGGDKRRWSQRSIDSSNEQRLHWTTSEQTTPSRGQRRKGDEGGREEQKRRKRATRVKEEQSLHPHQTTPHWKPCDDDTRGTPPRPTEG
jgi:hypothetical protein